MKHSYIPILLTALLSLTMLSGCAGTDAIFSKLEDKVVDGFHYETETSLTKTLVCFSNSKGEPWLFDPSDNRFDIYEPRKECKVEPGHIYTINFDTQRVTGGVLGVHDSYFQKVYSREETDTSALFAQGVIANHIFGCRQTLGEENGKIYTAACDKTGNRFVIVYTGTDYMVCREDGSTLHFDESRQVSVPYETVEEPDKKLNICFRFLCNSDVSDECMINELRTGTITKDSNVFLVGTCSSDHESSGYAGDCAGVDDREILFCQSDIVPAERFRKVITAEQFAHGMTAEQAGVPENVFNAAESAWRSEMDSPEQLQNGKEQYAYQRGVVILGGDYSYKDVLFMDDNARFCITDGYGKEDTQSEHANYAIFTVRGEYLDLFPQE